MNVNHFLGILIFLLIVVTIPVSDAVSTTPILSPFESENKTVLMVFSLSPTYPFYQNMQKGFSDRIAEISDGNLNIVIDYLNFPDFQNPEYESLVSKLYRNKIAILKPSVIVISEWDAYISIIQSGSPELSEIPILYVGALPPGENLTPNTFHFNSAIQDFYLGYTETLSIAAKLVPKSPEIVIIAGSGTVEQARLSEFKEIAHTKNLGIPLRYLTNISYQDLLEAVQIIPEGTIILFSSFAMDSKGKAYTRDIVKDIHNQTLNPIFAPLDTTLGYGVVGGYMYSGEKYGRSIADLIPELLQGKRPDNHNFQIRDMLTYIFDWNELSRSNLDWRLLPAESIILNREESVVEKYFWYIILVVIVIILETILITILLLNRRSRIRAENELRESEVRFRTLYEYSPAPIILIMDDSLTIVKVNQAFEQLCGRSADELVGSSVDVLFLPDERECSLSIVHDMQNNPRKQNTELRIMHSNGSILTILWNTAHLLLPGSPENSMTIIQGRDITEEQRLEKEKRDALQEVQLNLAQMAVLNDGIRNPLMIIAIHTDSMEDPTVSDSISESIQRIDDLVNQIDKRWILSKKVLDIIRKHDDVNPDLPKNSED